MITSHIISFILIIVLFIATSNADKNSRDTDLALKNRIVALEKSLAAKTPVKVKFYTVPGYDCETGPIAGHCTKWNITQAAYDKDFFKEVGQ